MQERREHHARPEHVDAKRAATRQRALRSSAQLDVRGDAVDPAVEPAAQPFVEIRRGEPQVGVG
jgi:hypothetical protein